MRFTPAFVGLLCLIAAPTKAADLSRQSRLGEVFAEPPVRVVIRGRDKIDVPPAQDVILPFAPRTPGYYGRSGDYVYRSYYGTSPATIFTRLPYACGFVGLC